MTLSIKPRLSKKCIGFIVVFPLLIVTSLVNVECPVCQGTCLVSSAPEMENVEIIDVKSEGQFGRVMQDMMLEKVPIYLFDVELLVVNNGPDATEGYVKLVLVNLEKGDEFAPGSVIDTQYVTLEIPGETSLDVSYSIWFLSVWLLRPKVYAEVVIDDVPDVTCNVTGKVPLNTWLLVNCFKDSLLKLGGEGVQYETGMVFD